MSTGRARREIAGKGSRAGRPSAVRVEDENAALWTSIRKKFPRWLAGGKAPEKPRNVRTIRRR